MTIVRKVEPFVLKNKEQLPAESAPKAWQVYDPGRQLWVDARSGEPLVGRAGLQDANNLSVSQFGETGLKKSVEGADQGEISTFAVEEISESKNAVGAEQTDWVSGALPASPFGETTLTKTREGTDETEGLRHSDFGETTLKETREGADQPDAAQATDHPGW